MATAGVAIASSKLAAEAIAVEAAARPIVIILAEDRQSEPADRQCAPVAADKSTTTQRFPMLEARGLAQLTLQLPIATVVDTPAAAHRMAVAADMLAANASNR
jgi:hypothetical protein